MGSEPETSEIRSEGIWSVGVCNFAGLYIVCDLGCCKPSENYFVNTSGWVNYVFLYCKHVQKLKRWFHIPLQPHRCLLVSFFPPLMVSSRQSRFGRNSAAVGQGVYISFVSCGWCCEILDFRAPQESQHGGFTTGNAYHTFVGDSVLVHEGRVMGRRERERGRER